MKKLSIIILNFNTTDLVVRCINSLLKYKNEVDFEIVLLDNGSSDSPLAFFKNKYKRNLFIKIVDNKNNIGFAAGNNRARKYVEGQYVLFLNSDTIVHKNTLKESVAYLEENKDAGALTCKIVLPDGSPDKDSRRSFITPWIGLTHIFLKLDRIFPKSKLFSKYWYGYMDENKIHEVDALQGAFFLTHKKILDEVGWFCEDYFLDGEDIDLSFKIKEKGFKNVYYPKIKITHFKGSSKGKVENKRRKEIRMRNRIKFRLAGVNSMQIFYKKHLWQKYPLVLNFIVIVGIFTLKVVRLFKTIILG